ncbi:MAG: EAL domain-containing protein [Glaciecola sp.]
MTITRVFLLFLLCFFSINSHAHYADQNTNKVLPTSNYPIDVDYEYFEDNTNQENIASIKNLPSHLWQKVTIEQASFGFQSSAYWVRTSVSNQTQTVTNFILEVDYSQLDHVDFYAIANNQVVKTLSTGDMKAFSPRDVNHPSNLFTFQLAPSEFVTVFVRVQTQGALIIPVKLWEEQIFFEAATSVQNFHFFYFGVMVFIILINLAVFVTLRERLYLYYTIAISGYLLFFATSSGHFYQLFTAGSPELTSRIFLVSMPLLALFSVLFARAFLQSATHSPKLDLALKAMIAFEIVNLIMAFFAPYNVVVKMSAVGAVLLFSVLFLAGPITCLVRKRAGLFFTVAWTSLTIGFVATSGRTSGVLPNTFFTEYAMQIGSLIEAVVLTLALANRLFVERAQKIKAQADSLEQEKQRNIAQTLLTEAMSRDPITKLSNRNRFEWLVQKTIDANPNERYILAVAQISRLDDLVRTLGLSSTERIIGLIADSLNKEHAQLSGVISFVSEQGEKGCVYQLSRDLFGSFMRQDTFEKDPELYYEVLRRTAEPIEVEGLLIDLAPLYGSALYPKHGISPSQLIRNAVIALEQSKHANEMMGIFHDELDIYDEDRLTLVTHLREALEQQQLVLYYQPKFNVSSHQVIGVEALVRWVHPTRGIIPPDDFIPLAEETGLINTLTLWAIEQAIVDMDALNSKPAVSINISARDLVKKSFVDDIKKIFTKHSVIPQSIYLELTETAVMEDPKVSIATLNALANMGINISVDDFGSGYSSLSYLQRLPAAEVKLDRSLISEICQSENAAIIVKASIDMAHALGYVVVAEGVEDECTNDYLREYNCDTYQGFWRCKPLPLLELQKWLTTQHVDAS